ncbi:phage tail spike protein [uncultured Vagococcus sp.]|uniref:phage tail spike protein n=1 Tax=uncultured Vagococcus sp. TaxID=189676 RepID=UPI0028D1B1A4|nr:phage tail spike protein [uncultured Vagococcus sp.]
MSESVYFFDDNQHLILTAFGDQLLRCTQDKEIKDDKSILITDVLTVATVYEESIKDAAYMAVKELDDEFSMYRILKISEPDNTLSFIGVNFGPDELHGSIVKDIRPSNESMRSIATRLLEGTGWRLGHVDSTLKAVSGSFYYISVKESLKYLQTLGCEILFKCTIEGDGVTDKWIEVYKQIGVASNHRFTYGETALSVVKEQDRSQVFTSLIGRGRGEEVGDGYGRRLEFADVEWKKSSGDPFDKPKGQNWLETPEMTALYGIPTKTGMKKREQVVIFEDIENPKELLQATCDQLIETSRPLTQFKTTVLGGDAIGNTVTINRYDRDYHYRARVFKTSLDRLTGRVYSELGDNINKTSSDRVVANEMGLTVLDKSKMSFYETTETSKYQSDIIRGAKGGSILLMNPEDTGQGNSREPYQMVWMNGQSLDTSDHFLVANSEGIGFIDGDFNMSKFKTAWTIDGTFNADYIRAGVIRAGIFESSFNGTGDTLRLVNGLLQIWNASRKIMELTKKGLEFWRGSEGIGEIGTTGELPDWVAGYSGPTDRAIQVKLNGGDFIKVFNESDDGLYIPARKHITGENSTRVTLFGQDGIDLMGTGTSGVSLTKKGVEIMGKLFVGGQEVTPGGQGGGGWNGQYPPEITTQAEKYAWQLWMTLLPLGYSKASIAGILGNVQGEVGPSMNPDTAQSGGAGPGYGAVQWDGSAYPLVGSPTWNGREYVQRLMNAASITESYVTMVAQGKLIDWCMFNGQWIGAVSPTTVAGFKAETSAANAALAFELNFERPASAHPERQGWAIEWYNKFVNLVPPTSSGEFMKPLDAPVIITSEFGWRESPTGGGQELHNGIDLVNNNNSAPIYASNSGTVVFSANGWNGGYGNYIIIQHKPNLFTGYGHNSQLLVSVGATVTKGQKIAIIGESGNVTGIHTHFQFMEGTDMWSGHVNPRNYIDF